MDDAGHPAEDGRARPRPNRNLHKLSRPGIRRDAIDRQQAIRLGLESVNSQGSGREIL